MKTFRILGALALGASAVAFLPTTAMAADTDTTFSITSGSLSLTAATSAPLGDDVSGTTTFSGSLGLVSVTDERGSDVAWDAVGSSTAFTGARLTGASSSTAVSYTGGVVTASLGTIVGPGTATTLTTTPASVVAPTAILGNNTASWEPTLDVTMPASALADDYTGTVTTSVS